MTWNQGIATAFAIGVLTVGSARAAEPYNDNNFFQKATVGTLTEIDLGNIALLNAAAQDVKDFGKKAAEDHKKIHENLSILAKNAKLTLPTNLPEEEKGVVEKFRKLRGAEFDREYSKKMVECHEKSVALYEEATANSGNPQIKSFAKDTLPTLKDHLEHAKKLQATHTLK